jgi:hypothetical protein
MPACPMIICDITVFISCDFGLNVACTWPKQLSHCDFPHYTEDTLLLIVTDR